MMLNIKRFDLVVVKAVMAVSLFLFYSLASASGSGGGFGAPRQAAPADPNYDYGKAIYSGRQKGIGRIKYCVANGQEKIKVKKSSLKAYKGRTYQELMANLYDCNKPEEQILSRLGNDNTYYVVYYLNKRYRLGLRR